MMLFINVRGLNFRTFRFHSYHCDIHMISLSNLYIPVIFHTRTYLQQLCLHGCDFSFKFSGILVILLLKETNLQIHLVLMCFLMGPKAKKKGHF